MENFISTISTKVIFGKGAISHLGEEFSLLETKKILIVYGSNRIEKNGILDDVVNTCIEQNIQYELFSNIKANPTLRRAKEGVEIAKKFCPDLILAIGGGSVIDTAKAIAIGALSQFDLWDIWTQKVKVDKAINVAAILTIAAAGSEMSDSAVLTNEDTKVKRGLSSVKIICKFAIEDPTYLMTLPKYQIACGVVDILMHTLDRFFYPKEKQNNDMTDEISYAVLKNVIKNGKIAYDNPKNYKALSEIMWSSSLSHNGITGFGTSRDFTCHQLGHELSAMFDVAHGASLSCVFGALSRYLVDKDIDRYVALANNVWKIDGNDLNTALKGIKAFEDYFKSLDMPTSLKELNCSDFNNSVIEKLAYNCTRGQTRTICTYFPMGMKEIIEVYNLAK